MGSFSGTQRNAPGASPVARADACRSATDSISFGTSTPRSSLSEASDCLLGDASEGLNGFSSDFGTSVVAFGGDGGEGDAVDCS